MQTENFKGKAVSIQQQKVESKLISNSLMKQTSHNQMKNDQQKNIQNQNRETSIDKLNKNINQANQFNDKYSIALNDHIKNQIPNQFIKTIQRYGTDDQNNNKKYSKIDQKVNLPHLQNKINDFDEQSYNNNTNDSLIHSHIMISSQFQNKNNSISPRNEAIYNIENPLQYQKDIKNNQSIYQKRILNERSEIESCKFFNQENKYLIDDGKTLKEKQIISRINKQCQTYNSQNQQDINQKDGENTYRNKKRVNYHSINQTNNNQIEEIFEKDHKNKQINGNNQIFDNLYDVSHSNTSLANKIEQRNKRSKSQYQQSPLQRSLSPIKHANNKSNTFSLRDDKLKIENKINQSYDIDQTLISQLSSLQQQKYPYLNHSFQSKQLMNRIQNNSDSQQIMKQKYINSNNENKTRSISLDQNKNTIKHTKNDETSSNNKINGFPQINKSIDLNKTFKNSPQLLSSQPPSKNIRSLSNNCSSSQHLKQLKQNIKQKCNTTKNSPLKGQRYDILNSFTNAVTSRENNYSVDTIHEYQSSSITKQNILNSQNTLNNQNTTQSNISNVPKIKLQKPNLKDTIYLTQQQNTLDDQSQKNSLFSSRIVQQGNSQMQSSPRSYTSTAKGYHEKLIYKHLNQLILQKNGMHNNTATPRLKQPTINIESLLNNSDDSSRFLRHYLNKVEILFSSIERKDMDHIILLVSNLLDVLVEMNEINLFCQFTLFLGCVAKDFNHIDKAIFFYNQLDILASNKVYFIFNIYFLQNQGAFYIKFLIKVF